MPVCQFLERQHHREYHVRRAVQVNRENQVVEVQSLDVDGLHEQREQGQQQEHQARQIVRQKTCLDRSIEARVLSKFEQNTALREPGDKNEERDADHEVEPQWRRIRAATTIEKLGCQRSRVEEQRLDGQGSPPIQFKGLFDDVPNQAPDRSLKVDVSLTACLTVGAIETGLAVSAL